MADHLVPASGAAGLADRARELAARLSPLQKIAVGAAALTLVAGALILSQTGGDTSMSPLYTDLASGDAAAVVDELAGRGVEYTLADAGRTILVPADSVYDLRLTMSAAGLPSSNDGYALLDQQGITTSEFRQRIDYQRALEGEIARTIRAMNGVSSATVHLVLPEESVFVDVPSNATASVMVAGRGANALGDEQVDAIVHLVSSSVKNLAPGDVTVISAEGTVLSAPGRTGTGASGATARAKAEAAFEQELAASITAMLTRVTGPGRVSVAVSADLDLSQRQATSETFANVVGEDGEGNGAVVAERTSSEVYTGGPAGDTGVLGPDGVVVAPEVAGGDASEYERDDAERTFALDRTVAQVTDAPGTIERISVAVLLDGETVDAAQIAPIEAMVVAAAGIDAGRGDAVEITLLPFDAGVAEAAAAAAEAEAAAAAEAERMQLIRTLSIVGLALVALLLAFLSARRARKVVTTPIDVGEITAARTDGPVAPLGGGGATAELPAAHDDEDDELTAADVPAALHAGDPAPTAAEQMMNEISELADARPEEVASILRTWLAESPSGTR